MRATGKLGGLSGSDAKCAGIALIEFGCRPPGPLRQDPPWWVEPRAGPARVRVRGESPSHSPERFSPSAHGLRVLRPPARLPAGPTGPRPMSRRKAGCTPRRVDPAPAANPDDELEMPDLVIEMKTEPVARPLQAPGFGLFSPKEMPASGHFEGEPCHSSGHAPAGGPLHALGARNQWALWTPLVPSLIGERRLPLPRAPPPTPFIFRWDSVLWAPTPAPASFPSPVLASSPTSDLRVFPLGTLSPHPGPTPRLPPASSLQTASPGPTNTQIC